MSLFNQYPVAQSVNASLLGKVDQPLTMTSTPKFGASLLSNGDLPVIASYVDLDNTPKLRIQTPSIGSKTAIEVNIPDNSSSRIRFVGGYSQALQSFLHETLVIESNDTGNDGGSALIRSEGSLYLESQYVDIRLSYNSTGNVVIKGQDNNGKLLIGLTNPVVAPISSSHTQSFYPFYAVGSTPDISFINDGNLLGAGNPIGDLKFYSRNSSGTPTLTAYIEGGALQTHTNSSMPTYISFRTTPVGLTAPSEVARFTSNGLKIGFTDSYYSYSEIKDNLAIFSTGLASSLIFHRSNTARQSGSALTVNDIIGTLYFRGGYDGIGGSTTGAYIQVSAAGNWTSSTVVPSSIDFYVAPTSGSPAKLLSLTGSRVEIASPSTTYDGTSKLLVDSIQTGTIKYANNIDTTITTAGKTLALADQSKVFLIANAGTAITITIPANVSVSFPVGTQIDFILNSASTAAVTFAITTDTLVYTNTNRKLIGAGNSATIIKVSSNVWHIFGNLSA